MQEDTNVKTFFRICKDIYIEGCAIAITFGESKTKGITSGAALRCFLTSLANFVFIYKSKMSGETNTFAKERQNKLLGIKFLKPDIGCRATSR